MKSTGRHSVIVHRGASLILIFLLFSHAGAAKIPFDHAVIDKTGPPDPWIKIAGDINGDGFPDVIIGGQRGPLVWYGYPDWTKTLVTQGGYSAVDGEVADMDRDGDLDIVMGGVLWYENPRPKASPAQAPWKAHKIGTHRSHDVEVVDLDGDSDLDVITRDQSGFGSKAGNKIYFWRQDTPVSWTKRIIDCPHGEGLTIADMDHDADLDVVIGGRWYENTKDVVNGPWTEHVFSTAWGHADTKVKVSDLNGDGRPDIVLTPAEGEYRISWFEAPPKSASGKWKEHVIEKSIGGVHSLQIADMDGDGDFDVITAKMHQYSPPHEVSVYLNEERGSKWAKQVLSTKGSHNIRVADIGSDGDIDVFGANWSGPYQPVEMWENKRNTGGPRSGKK